jgi:hypothetical protein
MRIAGGAEHHRALIVALYPSKKCTHRAGDGNRTHVVSLEGWSSTIELHPHRGGGSRIRTCVDIRRQIYSLMPLTARPLLLSMKIFWHIKNKVKGQKTAGRICNDVKRSVSAVMNFHGLTHLAHFILHPVSRLFRACAQNIQYLPIG